MYVTAGILVELIDRHLKKSVVDVEYGWERGWLEEQDWISPYVSLERRAVARILHNVLRLELKEPDEADITPAKYLKDLYDCRSCVNHVAQVYCKGIIERYVSEEHNAETQDVFVFGMRKYMTQEDAETAVERVFRKECRRVPDFMEKAAKHAGTEPLRISLKEARECLVKEKEYHLLDVRTKDAYEKGHLPGAEHYSFIGIMEHPESIMLAKDCPCFIYCEGGFQSELVANCLAEAGFRNIRYFGLEEEKDYA